MVSVDNMENTSTPVRVSCPEKILIILDPSKEMGETYFNAEETNLRSNFTWIKIALKKFLLTKSIMNKKHQFALALLQPDGLFWYQEFTPDVKLVLDCLNDTEPVEEEGESIKEISLDTLFKDVSKHVGITSDLDQSIVPKFIVRTILFYGRSQCPLVLSEDGGKLVKRLYTTKRFTFDSLYISNSTDTDCDTEGDVSNSHIMSCLNNHDSEKTGYHFEVCENLAQLFECMAKLLSHPLQRVIQPSASYTLKMEDESMNNEEPVEVDSNGVE